MKFFFPFLFFVALCCSCRVQNTRASLKCGGLNILDVKPAVKGFEACSYCDIPVNSISKGFSIVLSDSTYKIVGLRIIYTNNKGQIKTKDVSGDTVNTKKIDFLNDIEVGNFISIECINIKKRSELALSTSMLIYVTN